MAGNATEQACLVDGDCPGGLVCYKSELAWTSGTSKCDCTSKYGLYGANCDEPTAYFYVSVVSIVVSIAVSVVLAVLSFRDARYVARKHGGLTASSSNACPAFATAALLALMAWRVAYLLEFLLPMEGSLLIFTSSGKKQSRMTDVGRIAQVFMVTLVTLGLLNLSLGWLEVSRSAIKFSSSARRKMKVYRAACTVLGTALTVLNVGLAALRMVSYVVLVSVPISLGLGLLFIAGRRRVEALLSSGRELADKSNNTALKKRLTRTEASMKRCCTQTIVSIFTFVGGSLLWFWLMRLSPTGGWEALTSDGVGCWPQLTYEFISLALLSALHAQYVYSHASIATRVQASGEAVQTTVFATSMAGTAFRQTDAGLFASRVSPLGSRRWSHRASSRPS